MKNKKNLTGIGIVLIIITILAVGGVVYAGTITPPSGTPAAQFYTLSEIYNFITSNTTATEGGHGFTFSDSLEGTGRTLTEIYSSLASLISADKVKSGTTYLNVAGSLVPNGGTATAAGLFNGLTAHLTGDWDFGTRPPHPPPPPRLFSHRPPPPPRGGGGLAPRPLCPPPHPPLFGGQNKLGGCQSPSHL